MKLSVNINGVQLIPALDYVVDSLTIKFSKAPPHNSIIQVTELLSKGASHVTMLSGTGEKTVFPLDTEFATRLRIREILDMAWLHHAHPAVNDAINQLHVVLELIKQDEVIR